MVFMSTIILKIFLKENKEKIKPQVPNQARDDQGKKGQNVTGFLESFRKRQGPGADYQVKHVKKTDLKISKTILKYKILKP